MRLKFLIKSQSQRARADDLWQDYRLSALFCVMEEYLWQTDVNSANFMIRIMYMTMKSLRNMRLKFAKKIMTNIYTQMKNVRILNNSSQDHMSNKIQIAINVNFSINASQKEMFLNRQRQKI